MSIIGDKIRIPGKAIVKSRIRFEIGWSLPCSGNIEEFYQMLVGKMA
jgi:hypothetical protein